MKKWQKIIGIIGFLFIFIALSFWNFLTYYGIEGVRITEAAHDCKDWLYLTLNVYNIFIGLIYFLSLMLFVRLWKKGDKK